MEHKINICERCPNTSDEVKVSADPIIINQSTYSDPAKYKKMFEAYSGDGYFTAELSVNIVRNNKGIPADLCTVCREDINEAIRRTILVKPKPKPEKSTKLSRNEHGN